VRRWVNDGATCSALPHPCPSRTGGEYAGRDRGRSMVAVSLPIPTVTPADERRAGEGATAAVPVWAPRFDSNRRTARIRVFLVQSHALAGSCVHHAGCGTIAGLGAMCDHSSARRSWTDRSAAVGIPLPSGGTWFQIIHVALRYRRHCCPLPMLQVVITIGTVPSLSCGSSTQPVEKGGPAARPIFPRQPALLDRLASIAGEHCRAGRNAPCPGTSSWSPPVSSCSLG
jgi:hypothetical protein